MCHHTSTGIGRKLAKWSPSTSARAPLSYHPLSYHPLSYRNPTNILTGCSTLLEATIFVQRRLPTVVALLYIFVASLRKMDEPEAEPGADVAPTTDPNGASDVSELATIVIGAPEVSVADVIEGETAGTKEEPKKQVRHQARAAAFQAPAAFAKSQKHMSRRQTEEANVLMREVGSSPHVPTATSCPCMSSPLPNTSPCRWKRSMRGTLP